MKTQHALEALSVKDGAFSTPLLRWDTRHIPDFISVYKNDEYHNKYYNMYLRHLDTFWTKEEVSISEDFNDWNALPEQDRRLILNILRIFTQADASVLDGYSHMMTIFAPMSIKMMLGDFLAREGIHTDAYSFFTDTLGYESDFYKEFLEIPEMSRKFYFIEKAKVKKDEYYIQKASLSADISGETEAKELARKYYIQDVIRMLVCYSLFMEGIELFAMFSKLFSYRVKKGLMRKLATIVEWSIRDESQHVMGNASLINDIIRENPHVMDQELIDDIYGMLEEVLLGQEDYINLLYQDYVCDGEGVTKEDLLQFNRYIGNYRLRQIGMEAEEIQNPFPWLDEILLSPTLTNFFSDVVTEYPRTLKGDRNSIRSNLSDYSSVVAEKA